MPKYIVKNDKIETRSQSKLELMHDSHSMTQQQSIDRGSFKNYTEAKHTGGKGRGGNENSKMNRSQALLARGQQQHLLSDEQRALTSFSGMGMQAHSTLSGNKVT